MNLLIAVLDVIFERESDYVSSATLREINQREDFPSLEFYKGDGRPHPLVIESVKVNE